MDSAKLVLFILINKKLQKCNPLTLRLLLLEMNGLQLQENLKKYTRIEDCPIRNVLSRFSSKWAMLILCVLSENEATRFNTISKAIPDISPKVLTETLKALEADGLVKRKLYAEIPPRVEYSLTEVGQSLIPILNSLITWALNNSAYISKRRKK